MIGYELEISLPITDKNGAKLDGETELGSSTSLPFRLVSDKRQGNSNIEFVTEPVSVVGRTGIAQGQAQLLAILAGIKELRDALYKAGDAGFAAAAGKLLKPTAEGRTARLTPSNGYKDAALERNGGDGLFLHYSVGVPFTGLSAFFDFLRKNAPYENDAFLRRARWRTLQAKSFADDATQLFIKQAKPPTKAPVTQVNGYLQLVYTQVAAMADYVARPADEGQIKNETVALCRSAFCQTFPLLDASVRAFLTEGFTGESLVNLIAKYQEDSGTRGVKLEFQEHSSREIDGAEYTLIEYTRSALTGEPVIPQQGIFGKMTQLPPEQEQGKLVIPFEIRTLGSHYKTWDQVAADLRSLTSWVQAWI